MNSSRPVVLLGPTAGGKSDLAVALAQHWQAQIIGADSMQVYRHLDAGTAKPTPAARQAVPHHLIDLVEPAERFTVHDWLGRALALLTPPSEAHAFKAWTSATPRWVVVGGTNLYLKTLLEGLFAGPGQDPAWRATVAELPPGELHDRLRKIDPDAAARIAPADRPRLTRALEVHHLTGQPISTLQTQWSPPPESPPEASAEADFAGNGFGGMKDGVQLVGLRWPVEAINPRINLRVKAMFYPDRVDPELAAAVCPAGESLPAEAARLVESGILQPGMQACEALGYKQVLHVLYPERFAGAAPDPQLRNLDDAFERTKILTRRFAKQQRTWLKRFADVLWIDMPCDDPAGRILESLK